MKRFSFRLDRLLELRTNAERERARAMAEAVRAEEAKHRTALEAAERLRQAATQLAGTPPDLTTAGTLRNLELAMARVAAEAAEARHQHCEAISRLEGEAQRYQEARVARRAVERLREHRHAAWTKETSREEQRELDEVAGRRPGRQGGNS